MPLTRPTTSLALAALLLAISLSPDTQAQEPGDNIGHDRHKHHHNPRHHTDMPYDAAGKGRFITSRKSDIVLPLPNEQDAFTFIVFGDRTGGPVEGVSVLADAVRDTNLIEPDLVMTVGDLVNGYNDTAAWMEQMKEFKGIMGELLCPWFPVAGNHDVYFRGPAIPASDNPVHKGLGAEHDQNYEMHFGPLWYAFEHKNCWFIALYSDEGSPVTGEKNFNKPECQTMSDEQFNWLKETLVKAKGADHVFLFLHHPRWTGLADSVSRASHYGTDWERVHKELVAAGNVTAVFGGHIHRMRSDPRDGIEYVTAATVGGHQDGIVPAAGWLHSFHLITVRKDQVAMAAIPVGEVMDVREMTSTLAAECAALHARKIPWDRTVALAADGSLLETLTASISNPGTRPIEITAMPESMDSRWSFAPDHAHARIEPGQSANLALRVHRPAPTADAHYRIAELVVSTDYLMPTHRYTLPERRVPLPLSYDNIAFGPDDPRDTGHDHALSLDGNDALAIPNDRFTMPDGPFTLECWIRADSFASRVGVVCKTEQSDYGLFADKGQPSFSVFLGPDYVEAQSKSMPITTNEWHHLAGVYDGSEVWLYIDGKVYAKTPAPKGPDGGASGNKRRMNKHPLIIGADVDGDGHAHSFFKGQLDGVRLSTGARYTSEFTPDRRHAPDAQTLLLYNFDGMLGPYAFSDNKPRIAAEAVGRPVLVEADEP